MTTVLHDSHVVHWWSAEPERLSRTAARAIDEADEPAVSAITGYELAWLATHERIEVSRPRRYLAGGVGSGHPKRRDDASHCRPSCSSPVLFPGDTADRVIYATAVENGWQLLTKDRR